jgi:iron complex transport system permease protein
MERGRLGILTENRWIPGKDKKHAGRYQNAQNVRNAGDIRNSWSYRKKFGLIGAALSAVFVLSLFLGRYSVTPGQLAAIIRAWLGGYAPDVPRDVRIVFTNIRIPRIITALLAGAGLSVSGCAYQGVFRNPMVSPDILGATAGAGLGAAAAILAGADSFGVQAAAFCTGIIAVLLSYATGTIVGVRGQMILPLVLSGIVVSALFRAGISLIKTTADPFNKLPAITFWLLGSLSSAGAGDILYLLIPIGLGVVPLLLLSWRINLLSFGDEEAAAMGLDPVRTRLVVIVCSSAITAAVVSVGGLIEWVGLVIPHLARMIVGPDYKALIPASLLLGGGFLLFVDDLARSLLASEISLGILTSMMGAPFFIYLMLRQKRENDES